MALRNFTFADVYRHNAQFFPEHVAFVVDGNRVTHRDYLHRIERLAAGLVRNGVKAGDRVAILAQNSLEMVDLIGALARLGAVLLPVNFRLNADEIGYVLADGTPTLVIAGPDYRDTIAALAPSLTFVREFYAIGAAGDRFAAFDDLTHHELQLEADEPDPDAPFVIIHTAAVGGRPRGAVLSQTNLLTAQSALVQAWGMSERDVNLGILPLFHVTGLGLMLTTQQAGGTSVISAKFEPAQAARDIAAEKVTVMAEFAPILANLLDNARPNDLATLRAVTGLDTPDTITRFEATCPGVRFWATYGQSETSGLTTLSLYRDRPKSAGRPLFWRTVTVVDSDDRAKPVGETGEIVVRGPTVFQGYWNNEADTAFTFRNGWHHTGDMGYFDADGYLWYAGRAPEKELIKTGGENVYPAEVEAAIRQHPAVADVAVIGVPDPQWGEAIKAVCVLKQPTSADDIIAFVGDRIARYKKPKHIVFVEGLPKTGKGDADRAAIKAMHGMA